jgi:ABC-type glutathione transport system ATPase component
MAPSGRPSRSSRPAADPAVRVMCRDRARCEARLSARNKSARNAHRRGGPRSTAPVIQVEHLRKRCPAAVAVDDVSFTVAEGEIFGILGPNGAGKTTTVECIEGVRTPDRGRIEVLGLDPRRAVTRALSRLPTGE